MKAPRILVVAACHSVSKGEESVLKATIEGLRKSIPAVHFTIFSSCPEIARSYGLENVKISGNFLVCLVSGLIGKFFELPTVDSKKVCVGCSMRDFVTSDVVLLNSGDILTSAFGRITYLYLMLLILAKILRKLVIVYAQTIDPPASFARNIVLKMVLNMLDLITVRDEMSFLNIREMRVRRPKVVLTADPALILRARPNRVIERKLNDLKASNPDKPLVGIAISSTIFQYAFRDIGYIDGFKKGVELMVDLLNLMIDELHAPIILIPHAYSPVFFEDDRAFAVAVWSRLRNGSNVEVLRDVYDAEELKYAISKLDILIAFRMHPLIHALSAQVPVIGVDYSGKMHQFMSSMHLPDRVIHVSEFSSRSLISLLLEVMAEAQTNKPYELEPYKRRAFLNIDQVSELINCRCKL